MKIKKLDEFLMSQDMVATSQHSHHRSAFKTCLGLGPRPCLLHHFSFFQQPGAATSGSLRPLARPLKPSPLSFLSPSLSLLSPACRG